MGQTGLGNILELGPERNLGCCYLVHLFDIYTYEIAWKVEPQGLMFSLDCRLHLPSDVLVGNKLSAKCKGKRAYLFYNSIAITLIIFI